MEPLPTGLQKRSTGVRVGPIPDLEDSQRIPGGRHCFFTVLSQGTIFPMDIFDTFSTHKEIKYSYFNL